MAYRDPVTGLIGGTPPGYSPSPVGGRRAGYTRNGLNVTVMLPPGVSLEEHLRQNPPGGGAGRLLEPGPPGPLPGLGITPGM